MKKTKTAAIRYARSRVSDLYRFGDGYRYKVYDEAFNAWHESTPRQYHAAAAMRSFTLLNEALDYLHGEDHQVPTFTTGRWTDYVNAEEVPA